MTDKTNQTQGPDTLPLSVVEVDNHGMPTPQVYDLLTPATIDKHLWSATGPTREHDLHTLASEDRKL